METCRAIESPSRSFYLAFRRWCIAYSASSAGHQQQQRPYSQTASFHQVRQQQRVGRINSTTTTQKEERCKRMQTSAVCAGAASRRQYSSGRILGDNGPATGRLDHNLRHALRTLTKPCVVVTASIPDSNAWTGATLSSFDTISFDPVPQVSFNIKVPSRTYDAFSRSGDVCVHILSATAQGALIADTFTKRYEDSTTPFGLLQKAGCTFTRGRDETAPKIYIEDGILARLICRRDSLSQEIDVGDHKLCTMTVVSVEHTTTNGKHDDAALAYGQQAFRSPGAMISPSVAADLAAVLEKSQVLDDADYRASTGSIRPSAYIHQPASTLSTNNHSRPTRVASAAFHTSIHRRSDAVGSRLSPIRLSAVAAYPAPAGTQVPKERMQETLEDFLCHSTTRPSSPIVDMRKARRHAAQYRHTLDMDEESQRLTRSERKYLEDRIRGNERFIAGRLGLDAAVDLNDMLDKGHVSKSRVQFLEQCIENGLVASLEEAQQFTDGQEPLRSYPGWNTTLKEFEVNETTLRQALTRLRALYEEEELD